MTKSTNNRLSLWLTNVYHKADKVMICNFLWTTTQEDKVSGLLVIMRYIRVEDVGVTLVSLLTNCFSFFFFFYYNIHLIVVSKQVIVKITKSIHCLIFHTHCFKYILYIIEDNTWGIWMAVHASDNNGR